MEMTAKELAEEIHKQTLGGGIKEMTIDDTLKERGARYGAFEDYARVTQRLKRIVTEELGRQDKYVEPDQQEALDMIFHKIGRIVAGDADYDDSWRDIAGYAMLVTNRLSTTPK